MHSRTTKAVWLGLWGVLLSACSGAQVVVPLEFPVPLVRTLPVNMAWHLDDELTGYVHRESLEKSGNFAIDLGAAQQPMFDNLSRGMFASHTFLKQSSANGSVNGVLKPSIEELQFSTPKQTRTDYYEVWIRYKVELFDPDGTLRGDWPLTAYGKANVQNYGMNTAGPALQAAAIAACRDAMAYFALHFEKVPVVKDWLSDQNLGVSP